MAKTTKRTVKGEVHQQRTSNSAGLLLHGNERELPSKKTEGKVTRANGRATRAAVRMAAVHLIYEHGYRSVSLRLLASEAGLQAGSLYNHFHNKQEMLFLLLQEIMDDLLEYAENSIKKADRPHEQLREFIRAHITFHVHRLEEVSIGNSELRNLEPDNLKIIIARRRRYFDLLHGIVEKGVKLGQFEISDTKIATRILIGMLNGVTGWYRANGSATEDDLIAVYSEMIFRALGTRHQPALVSPASSARLKRQPPARMRAK